MKLVKFDRWMLVILAALGLALAGIFLYSNVIGLKSPEPASHSVGAWGPIGLKFAQKMQAQSVESRWHSQPALNGRFGWDEQTLYFWPDTALDAAISYSFTLSSGSQAADGQVVQQDTSWTVQVREPLIVYQSLDENGSELWRAAPDGTQRLQLTRTGGLVYDFNGSRDGEWLAYSLKNTQQGSDMWLVRRDGSDARKAVDCSGDRCNQPAWSPDGKWIAYSRRRLSVVPGEIYSPQPRIWTLELASGKTSPLFQDSTVGGTNPTWSPDGKRVAFFDAGVRAIHMLNIETGKEVMLASKLGVTGTWTGNGNRFWYGDLETSETLPFGSAYMVDLANDQVQQLFTSLPDPEDMAAPVPTPDGSWVAVGVRVRGGSHSVQLQLMRPDGTERQSITEDFLYSHGAYSWNPYGQNLVYQRVQTATSSARPEVWIWNLSGRQSKMVAADGARPQWLP